MNGRAMTDNAHSGEVKYKYTVQHNLIKEKKLICDLRL